MVRVTIYSGRPVTEGRLPCTQVETINTYLLIEIRPDNPIQYHGNYIEVKKFIYIYLKLM